MTTRGGVATVQDPLELLSFAGVAAPLILTNVSFRTRDALLLYNTLRLTIDIASFYAIPIGTSRTLLNLVRAWGIDGRLLHDIDAEPLVISDVSGQWSLSRRAGLETIAAQVTSRSDLDEAAHLIMCLSALIGPADLITSSLAITASLWRAKRHEAYPWNEHLVLLQSLKPDSAVTDLLKKAEQASASKHQQEETEEEAIHIRKGLAIRARMLCVVLLATVPIVYFDTSASVAATIALMSSPSFSSADEHNTDDDLHIAGLVLQVLYSLGLNGALARQLVHLTFRPSGNGTENFKSDYLALHAALLGRIKKSNNTEPSLVALRRKNANIPNIKADAKVMATSYRVRLEDNLTALAGLIPLHDKGKEEAPIIKEADDEKKNLAKAALTAAGKMPDETAEQKTSKDEALKLAKENLKKIRAAAKNLLPHDSIFDKLSARNEHAVAGQPPEAQFAARAGAGLVHLLTSKHS